LRQSLSKQPVSRISTAIQDLYGNEAGTLSVDFVPEDTNSNPEISISDISEEVTGNVSIEYAITDVESDPCNLSPAFSINDGVSWQSVTTSSDTTAIEADSYSGTLLWQSASDLPGCDLADVRFRISVIDNDIEIGNADEITFHLDNNTPPSISISETVYTPADTTWRFAYQLDDPESDTLAIQGEYSIDDGSSWLAAHTQGTSAGISADAYNDSLTWFAGRDLPDATQEVLFRITPSDNDQGSSAERTVFVNSLGVPTLEVTTEPGDELSGDVSVEYVVDDINSDPIDLVFEYAYPAGSWHTATVTGSAALSGPDEYTGNVTWHSGTDLAGVDAEVVTFRITPSDPYNTGFGEHLVLHIDNNEPPVLSLTSPTTVVGRDIALACEISDSESDTVDIAGWWSIDKGITWQEMTLLSGFGDLLPADYSTSVLWRSFDDCGYGKTDSMLVKLTPADHDSGSAVTSGYFTVANYVGDFTGDVCVDFADFATLVTAWNEQDTYCDIGPATGTVPDLVPTCDGQIDFEDFTVYLQMWTWSTVNLASAGSNSAVSSGRFAVAEPDQTRVVQFQRQHPIMLEQPEPEDVWAPDSGFLDLYLEAHNVTGLISAGITLHYDTRHLSFSDVQPGTFLGRTGGSDPNLLFVERVDEEAGLIELMFGRIDPDEPDVSGGGRLATLQFEKLSRENSEVSIEYDLRTSRAEVLTAGIYTTNVTAVRIPDEFALLQNYPNPFNGQTTIRFQLPTRQRVRMYIYNVRGQRVATLLDQQMEPGYHRITWEGKSDDSRQVASGIYIYLIQAGRHRLSKKLTYIK